METEETKLVEKNKKKEVNKQVTYLKKLDSETFKLLNSIKDRVNKKNIGRKAKDCEIILAALRLIGPEHIKEIQTLTYSEKDRLPLAYEEYQRIHGKITMEQFINKLLSGANTNKTN